MRQNFTTRTDRLLLLIKGGRRRGVIRKSHGCRAKLGREKKGRRDRGKLKGKRTSPLLYQGGDPRVPHKRGLSGKG